MICSCEVGGKDRKSGPISFRNREEYARIMRRKGKLGKFIKLKLNFLHERKKQFKIFDPEKIHRPFSQMDIY